MNMRELFPGYYVPREEELNQWWEEGIFVFDTNMLLHIYRYQEETRESFFEVLRKLNNRIWIPYQVAKEYQERRLNVISDQINAYDRVKALLDSTLSEIRKGLNAYKERHSFIDPSQLMLPLTEAFQEAVAEVIKAKKAHPNLKVNDQLRETIDTLFNGKIGRRYSEEELEEKYKEAERRFERKIPPGNEDEYKKGLRKYGDVILWLQLIEYACSQKKPIIFVTDDAKEDWWLLHKDQANQDHPQPLGPRPELVQEMVLRAGVPFYMYQGYKFVKKAQEILALEYNKEVIKDIKDVGEQAETEARTARINAIARHFQETAERLAATGTTSPLIDPTIVKLLAGSRPTIDPAFVRFIASLRPNIDPATVRYIADFKKALEKAGYTSAPIIDTLRQVEDTLNSSNRFDTPDNNLDDDIEYACDRCGKPMSEKAYELRTICDDCWDDIASEDEE